MIIFEKEKYKFEYLNEFISFYKKANKKHQPNIEAMCISTSFNNKPSSRFVNIKTISNKGLIFYTDYRSNKAKTIANNANISGVFFWHSINVQIRLEGKAKKINKIISDQHFKDRSYEKNIAAITSCQSFEHESYEDLLKKYKYNYKKYLNQEIVRPDFWGGYLIDVNLVEFWEGKLNRLNKRKQYKKAKGVWLKTHLQP